MGKILDIPDEVKEAFCNVIKVYKGIAGFEDDPMDGDETEKMANIFLIFSDLHQGNITNDEFRSMLKEEGLP